MAYRIAGIDVHKKKLAVVIADVEVHDEYQFERRWYGSNPQQLQRLTEWLIEQQVEEVLMESTAQYWKPLWSALERYWKPTCAKREGAGKMSGTLHLAQALSNRGRRGRKKDFPDAERLVKRLVSQELTLSFVPDAEQRLWRTLSRTRYQRTRDKVRLQNQLEALLEEAHIKLSSLVSDLLGVSARRMLHALADGETDPAAVAALAHQGLRATPVQWCGKSGDWRRWRQSLHLLNSQSNFQGEQADWGYQPATRLAQPFPKMCLPVGNEGQFQIVLSSILRHLEWA